MKVLIISHNPISTHQNMGKTFLSLFSSFNKEELCQLYIYPMLPDVEVCDSYYRVTDKELVNSWLKLRPAGAEIDNRVIASAKASLFENAADETVYRNPSNHDASKRLLRDVLWKVSNWYTKSLKAWLDKEQPTCIFVAPSYAKFIYDIALTIAKDRNIPIITYICDDNYFINPSSSFLEKSQLRLLQRKTEKLMKNTTHLIAISEEIRQRYEQHFGVFSKLIMTGTNYEIAAMPACKDTVQAISYFGNIGCHRETSLAAVGKALDEINRESGTAFTLNIHTVETKPAVLKAFEGIESIRLCGFLSGKAFDEALHTADLLLHVEAFDAQSIDLVKYSVSTKIADGLSSGVPFVAYAPAQISSMEHLIRHQCALTATNEEELKPMLMTALFDAEKRQKVTERALAVAQQYHNCHRNSDMLRQMIADL